MSEGPFGVHSIGGVFLHPTPMLLDDYEEREEEDTHRPRRASASVILRGFYDDYFTELRSCEVAELRSYERGGIA